MVLLSLALAAVLGLQETPGETVQEKAGGTEEKTEEIVVVFSSDVWGEIEPYG